MKSIQNKTTRNIKMVGSNYIENVTIEYELDVDGLQQRIDIRKNALKTTKNIEQQKILEDDIVYFEEAKLKGTANRILTQQ